MRVVEINLERGMRGGELQTLYLCLELQKSGMDVVLVCREGGELCFFAREKGIKTVQVRTPLEVLPVLLRERANLVHAHTPRDLLFSVISKLILKIPVVFTKHTYFPPSSPFSALKYKFADFVICINESIKRMMEKFGIKCKVIPVIWKKGDAGEGRKLARKLGLFGSDRKKVVACVGAFTPEKNPLILPEVASSLRKIRDDFVFLHVGDGKLFADVLRKVRKLHLDDIYLCPGHIQNPFGLYGFFDVFVLPSKSEGTPLSLLDAMWYGVPLVLSDIPPLRECAGDMALFCHPENADCFALKIHGALEGEGGYDRAKARRYIAEKHSPKAVAKKYIEVFEKLCGM